MNNYLSGTQVLDPGNSYFPWGEMFHYLGTLELFMVGISAIVIIGLLVSSSFRRSHKDEVRFLE
ncbi:MAG: hypothetical protein LBS77_01205 [Desulfovibrio sp.]|nr:hypothetical protein [Desulfovibrio sp.]